MLKTLILNTDLNNNKNIDYLQKVAGLTILKRIILAFQYSSGENVFVITPLDRVNIFQKELDDHRIKIKIHFIDIQNIDQIINNISETSIYLGEPAVFEPNFFKKLSNIKIEENSIIHIGLDSHLIKDQTSKCFVISPEKMNKYSQADLKSDSFMVWLNNQSKKVIPINAFYNAIENKKDIRYTEKTLLQFLRKTSDPFISRNFNRPVSLFFTRFLMHLPITPNMMTMVTLGISLISVFLVLQVRDDIWTYIYGVLGGFMFHMASVIDGCDGELARLRYQFTDLGEMLDGMVDDIKNLLFVVAVGIRISWVYKDSPELSNIYYIGAWIGAVTFIIAKVLQYHHLLVVANKKDILDYTYYFEDEEKQDSMGFFSKFLAFFRNFARSDFLAFFTMISGFLAIYQYTFWIACVYFTAIFLTVIAQTILNRRNISS